MLEYKGYVAVAIFDDEAEVFHGEVLNTKDVITFWAENAKHIRQEFQTSVDEYLNWCQEEKRKPDKPYSGEFRLRLSPDLHRRVAIAARVQGKSLNAWIAECVEKAAKDSA